MRDRAHWRHPEGDALRIDNRANLEVAEINDRMNVVLALLDSVDRRSAGCKPFVNQREDFELPSIV